MILGRALVFVANVGEFDFLQLGMSVDLVFVVGIEGTFLERCQTGKVAREGFICKRPIRKKASVINNEKKNVRYIICINLIKLDLIYKLNINF